MICYDKGRTKGSFVIWGSSDHGCGLNVVPPSYCTAGTVLDIDAARRDGHHCSNQQTPFPYSLASRAFLVSKQVLTSTWRATAAVLLEQGGGSHCLQLLRVPPPRKLPTLATLFWRAETCASRLALSCQGIASPCLVRPFAYGRE